MNIKKKLCLTVFIQICFLFLLSPICTASAAEVSVSSLDEMKPYLEAAMEAYQPTYELNYTGSSLLTSSQLNTLFSSILSADGNDYISSDLKSRVCRQSGVKGKYTITFTFTYWETAEQVAEVDKKVTDVLSDLNVSGMNDYEKEKAIHDWIITNVVYDSKLTHHTASTAIVSGTTVCQGYAQLAYKMFMKAGLSARIVNGTGNGRAHAWNLVKVDGNWYQIDLTWDDPLSNKPDDICYDYYNFTDEEMSVGHKWKGTYPAASTEFSTIIDEKLTSDPSNSFYTNLSDELGLNYQKPDFTCNSDIDIQYVTYNQYLDEQNKVSFRYTNKSSLDTAIRAAMKSLGIINSYRYTYRDYPRTTLSKDVIVDLSFTTITPVKVSDLTYSDGTTTHQELKLVFGSKSETLSTIILPADASTKTVLWTTSDPAVAIVSNGVVRATGGGTAQITAKTLDGGKQLTCNVSVTANVKSIKLNKSTLPMALGGDDVTLTAAFLPVSATNKGLTWTSSNSNVATVTNGMVHAVATGKTVIKAISTDGLKAASCIVTVYTPSSGITVSVPSITVKLGNTVTLKASITPSTACNLASWSSSNEAIAKVSTSGVVTPVSAGAVTITASTIDGGFSADCEVTVIQGVTGIKLDKTKLIMTTGGSDQTLTATILPLTATIQSVTWKSSNTNVASVDSNGKVHAVGTGTATITCTSTQDSTKIARCFVSITAS